MSDEDRRELSAAQAAGFTDMAPEEFRRAAHQVVDMIADYLEHVEDFAVLPAVEPGSLRPLFPSAPPDEPEPLDAILGDVEALIEPNVTHWQHPGFFGWFATSASGAGMLGEFLTAGLGSNAMLWRASPVATELEQVVVNWLRQALGLPEAFDGLLTDTASTSTLIALAAAREAAGLQVAAMGLAGRPDLPPPVVYTSTEANLSVEKACMTLGIGRANVRRIPPDEAYRMDVGALASAIADDRVAGRRPIAIVPTIGTTSTTSVDPVAAIVDLAERERMWVHVDAAYAGAVALIPERRGPFAGWERANSVTMNPHKWLFTPLDASVLLTRRMDLVRAAFSLVPEYLGGLAPESPARDYNEYTPQLGRRFRALKLWILLRWFGLTGFDVASSDTSPSRRSSRIGSPQTRTSRCWRRFRSRPSASGIGLLASPRATTTARPRSRCSRRSTSNSSTPRTPPGASCCPTRVSAAGTCSGWPSATCGRRGDMSDRRGTSCARRRTAWAAPIRARRWGRRSSCRRR